MPFPVKLKPQKRLYLANTFLAPPPRGVAALVSVSDDKIQITILILRRGALSSKDGIKDEERMEDEGIFWINKLKLQAFSLAALEMSLGDIVVKVNSMMERSSIQITT